MKGEIGGSLLELGFVRTGVPGTSQAHPAFFLLLFVSAFLSLWLSGLSGLSGRTLSKYSLEEHI